MKVVLDSSGWVELLADEGRGHLFVEALKSEVLLVPTMDVYEVGRYALSHSSLASKEAAERVLARFTSVLLDSAIASLAADLSCQHKLSAADAIIYATAQSHDAELWTQDAHFKNLHGVKYFSKP